jgi:hypothetical protein
MNRMCTVVVRWPCETMVPVFCRGGSEMTLVDVVLSGEIRF